jgi:hypothetical protein
LFEILNIYEWKLMPPNASICRHPQEHSILEFFMPPPTFNSVPLRTQLAQLKQAASETSRVEHQSHPAKLRDQIKAWSESMTPEQRNRRFTIEEVERLAGLVGKFGGRAAHHHIAQSLRNIGFSPCRDWTVSGRNKRYWKWSK